MNDPLSWNWWDTDQFCDRLIDDLKEEVSFFQKLIVPALFQLLKEHEIEPGSTELIEAEQRAEQTEHDLKSQVRGYHEMLSFMSRL